MLHWQSTDNPDNDPLDQNADSLAVPHGFWAIGIDTMTNMWTVDLYEVPNIEQPGIVIDALSLPDVPTEALAKDAAQRREDWLIQLLEGQRTRLYERLRTEREALRDAKRHNEAAHWTFAMSLVKRTR
jgi:hypothetical protein